MIFFRNLVAMFFGIVLCVCGVNAAEKTETEYLNGAHFFLDVQRSGSGLTVIGKKLGVEKFRVPLQNRTAFSSFTSQTLGDYRLEKLDEGLRFQYRPEDSNEAIDMLIKENGDTAFLQTEDEYTGWNEHRTYGVRTFGTLENRTNQAFYFLVASANAIHNYGSINSYSVQFFQNYLFNSGVLQFGVMPTEIADLSLGNVTDDSAQPSFKRHTVENYGTFMSNGMFKIKGGLNFLNHGFSDFENLNTSGGDVNVSKGRVNVAGNMSGTVGSFGVGSEAGFSADKIGFSQLRDFSIAEHGSFHSPNSFNLNVSGSFSNDGELTSGDDLTLHLTHTPSTSQSGLVFAKSNLNYSYERNDRPRNATKAPNITRDPQARRILMQRAPDPNSPEFKRLQEEFYRRMGYDPDADRDTQTIFDPGQLLAQRIKQTIYTDHYLNTITYHYTVYQDQYGHETSRVLTDVTETGYVWQRRTQETRDITVPISSDLTQALEKKNQGIPAFRNAQRARMALAQELSRLTAAHRKAEMNARFWEAVKKALTGAGASDPDVQALLQDQYFQALVNWDNTPEAEQKRLQTTQPETVDLAEAIEDARYELHDFTKWLDNPVRRFLDDIVTPLSALAMLHPYTRAGAMAYSGVRGAIALAPRLAPALGRAAVVIGAGAVAGYDKIRAFFSEMSGGDGGGGGKDSGPSKGRIQNTPQEVGNYFQELRKLNVLGKGRRTRDGHWAYEIVKDFSYKGERFQKGNFISRDRLHHEIEWFKDADTHLGAIEPKTGTRYKIGDSTRKLRFK